MNIHSQMYNQRHNESQPTISEVIQIHTITQTSHTQSPIYLDEDIGSNILSLTTQSFTKRQKTTNKVDAFLNKYKHIQRRQISKSITIDIINIIGNTTTSCHEQHTTSKVKVAHISKETTYTFKRKKA